MEFTQAPDHKNWTPERKLEARDSAESLADLQNFVTGAGLAIMRSSAGPWIGVAIFGGLWWFAGWSSETLAAMLPKPW